MKFFDNILGVNENYWLLCETVARKVMTDIGKNPEEVEEEMNKVRRILKYGKVKE